MKYFGQKCPVGLLESIIKDHAFKHISFIFHNTSTYQLRHFDRHSTLHAGHEIRLKRQYLLWLCL